MLKPKTHKSNVAFGTKNVELKVELVHNYHSLVSEGVVPDYMDEEISFRKLQINQKDYKPFFQNKNSTLLLPYDMGI